MPGKKPMSGRGGRGGAPATDGATDGETPAAKPEEKPKPEPKTFPGRHLRTAHGSAVQPHRRYAARLSILGRPTIRIKSIYDDTGWTFGELGNVQVARVTDVKVLDAAMTKVSGPVTAPGGCRRRRHDFPDQSQCRQRAHHASVSLPFGHLRCG
ncbi:MAG: hypothetical protein WDO73_11300 [Ignavibacteriota bacterium]